MGKCATTRVVPKQLRVIVPKQLRVMSVWETYATCHCFMVVGMQSGSLAIDRALDELPTLKTSGDITNFVKQLERVQKLVTNKVVAH